jgi:hypothetical protein
VTDSVSAGWREVYSSLSVDTPDDPDETGEGPRYGFARAARESKP